MSMTCDSAAADDVGYAPSAWTRHYHEHARAVVLEPHPMFQMLERAKQSHGRQIFTEFFDERLSYAQAYEVVLRLASALEDLGINKGDRVGYCIPNHPLLFVTLFACWRIGAVATALNPAYPRERLQRQMHDVGVKLVISVDDVAILEKLMDPAAAIPMHVIVCPLRSIDPERDCAALPVLPGLQLHLWMNALRVGAVVNPVRIEPGDLAALAFTGGTTGGDPKAVCLTHANLSMNSQQMRCWFPRLQDGQEGLLAAAAFTHVSGLGPINNFGVRMAASLLVQQRFDPELTLDWIDTGKLTVLCVVPTMLTALLRAIEGRDIDWSAVKSVQSGAAPLTSEVRDRFRCLTGIEIVSLYGMTETSPATIYGTQDRGGDPLSTGVPLPGTRVEIRTLEAPERRAPVGAVGEICVAGPQVMSGYWKRPDLNRQCFLGEFFRTGDLGYLSAEGLFYVVDRLKDVIIAGGYNIYPSLVEQAIAHHPVIAEVAVVGMPDVYRGETAVACVALRANASLTLDDLRGFLRDKLSPMEVPTALHVFQSLPRTAAGKVSKAELHSTLMKTLE